MKENGNNLIRYGIFGLVVVLIYIGILYLLNITGYIVFVNRTSLIERYVAHLGSSIYFFSGNFLLFAIGGLRLKKTLINKEPDYHSAMYWDSVVNISLTLFFGIGVVYTAVGMQRAFQLALGSIDQEMATSMGPWGILQRLVEGGLLMALLTTIVGSSLGYFLRTIKLVVFRKDLIMLHEEHKNKPVEKIIARLEAIERRLSTINTANHDHE